MRVTHRFDHRYDVDRLVADLKTAEQLTAFRTVTGGYNGGGWNAIRLIAEDGSLEPPLHRYGVAVKYEKTPILRACPYFDQIIESFACPKGRVSLLRLEPGGVIQRHRDPEEAWVWRKSVRLHIPIITHDAVHFYVAGRRLVMRPGELWYCDFSRYHSVENRSPVARVHLVMDLQMNDWVRAFFPQETWLDHAANTVYHFRLDYSLRLHRAARAAGLGRLRERLRALIAH
jgi:hypothetical protein